jgi:hypothetical protein
MLITIAGAMAGYSYYHFIGCASGTCPITGNPWISSAYGGLIGWVLTYGKATSPTGSKKTGEKGK